MKNILVIGAGKSGIGASKLAVIKKYNVKLTDSNKIDSETKKILDSLNISWEEHIHSHKNLAWADFIVISPGVSSEIKLIESAKKLGIPIISEIEFASRFTDGKIIAITGTNGKTTTSTLLYHILKNANFDVRLCGNIGISFSEILVTNPGSIYVVEVSSFQLENISKFKPNISILLNLSPDHLDRYGKQESQYYDTKMLIQSNQDKKDSFIFFQEDDNIKMRLKKNNSQKLYPFGKSVAEETNVAWIDNNQLIIKNNKNFFTMLLHEMALQGKHNVYNSMAAGIAAKILGVTDDILRQSLTNFRGVEHRLETVLKLDGRIFINDSKATNCNAAYFALESIKGPIIWICGGVDKGNNYTELDLLVKEKVHSIIVLGKSTKKIQRHFQKTVENIIKVNSMRDAVVESYRIGKPGDNILLSPACSSFDFFQNYEERGRIFKECVYNL